MNGIHEAEGSNPSRSTTDKPRENRRSRGFLYSGKIANYPFLARIGHARDRKQSDRGYRQRPVACREWRVNRCPGWWQADCDRVVPERFYGAYSAPT